MPCPKCGSETKIIAFIPRWILRGVFLCQRLRTARVSYSVEKQTPISPFGRLVPESHARKILTAGCLLFIVLSVWGIIALPQDSDIWFYKHWSRLVTMKGISAAYSGSSSKDFVDYPPFLLYAWKVEGHIYQRFVDPEFDEDKMLESGEHTFGLALIATIFHVATGLALYRLLARRYGASPAATAALMYLLNPAVLFDIAYLGLPDTVHSFWLVLAFGLAESGSTRSGWVTGALAALTKPQAWGLAPLFLWRRFQADQTKQNLTGAAVALGTIALVIAPFIVNGKLADLCSLPTYMAKVQPYVSAQAHNLWWLATMGDGLNVLDARPLLGPLSYRDTSLILLAASGLLVLWLAHKAGTKLFLQLPAFQAFAWFCLTTRAHENHWFFVLPLAALALPSDRRMLWIFAAISTTGFLNVFLHNPFLGVTLASMISTGVIHAAQLLNSAANLIILTVWTVLLIRVRKRLSDEPAPSSINAVPPTGL